MVLGTSELKRWTSVEEWHVETNLIISTIQYCMLCSYAKIEVPLFGLPKHNKHKQWNNSDVFTVEAMGHVKNDSKGSRRFIVNIEEAVLNPSLKHATHQGSKHRARCSTTLNLSIWTGQSNARLSSHFPTSQTSQGWAACSAAVWAAICWPRRVASVFGKPRFDHSSACQ